MDDFMESPEYTELPGSGPESLVEQTMLEIGKTAELDEGDASWLETLVHRMVAPIADIFDHSEEGNDSGAIFPQKAEAAGNGETEAYSITEAVEEWHVQEGDNSCAVCSQQFIINEFKDLDLTEEQLCDIAEENGWFDPENGTSPSDVGKLLEHFGIETQVNYEGGIDNIKETLSQGGRVIVAVDSMVLWVDGFGNYPVYGADHAIEVIGIDDSDPQDVKVIINDSGTEDGCGQSVPYQEFMEAWTPSGGFMVSAFPGN